MIDVKNIGKDFKIHISKDGFWNKAKSLFIREYTVKRAVNDISFHIESGELVGYVGPNGAGKSTTIKMLSGILTPTRGTIVVDGIVPYEKRIQNSKNIGVVFGQRSQLYWDLPMRDSFLLHKEMYEIEESVYKRNSGLFVEILQMEKFIDQPIRQLSLGQKMRANIALSLLHNPKIVYLDEPTIGLDIVVKNRIREFILEVNRKQRTTFILTTHDMDDIEQVCNRLMMISDGRLFYDGKLSDFRAQYGDSYKIAVQLGKKETIEHPLMKAARVDEFTWNVTCDKKEIPVTNAVAHLMGAYDVRDIKIQERDIESILRELYEKG